MSKKKLVAPSAEEVAAARAVINRQSEVEYAAVEEENRALIGKHFKYRNTYGSGRKWWLYAKVTGVSGKSVKAWQAQYMTGGTIQIESEAHIYPNGGGWTAISAREFNAGIAKIKFAFLAQLAK